KTQSVLLGRERARKAYHGVIYSWLISMTVLIALFFTSGLALIPFMLIATYPATKGLLKNPLSAATRQQAMQQCLTLNIAYGAFYIAAILMGGSTLLVL
ncbi:MAG: prenyltransferase, partial [Raoultibacter sp.]